MRSLLLGSFFLMANITSPYLISGGNARAGDWGCEVILCLSNPGGPTQYAECRSPVEKLWRELAEGRPFPSCSGVGFHASQSGYEPYYCDEGYRLAFRYGDRGREAICVSITPRTVPHNECYADRDGAEFFTGQHRNGGERPCRRYVTTRPNVRPQPHYVDVTIDGVGKQRVWY